VERQATEAEARRQMDVFRKSLGQVEGKHEACQRYISDGNERKMRENDAQLGEIRREIVNLQTRRNQVDAEVSELRDQISQAQATHKNIRNNIDYREEIEEMDKVQAEITELDIDAATKARKEFNVEYKNMMAEENDVNSRVRSSSSSRVES
jgi:DNA repair protein RAD50